jgi:predicted dehydrogenase
MNETNKHILRVGVVGLGVMGTRLMNALHAHPGAEVRAVCDTNSERAQEVAQGIPGAAWSTDYRELLSDAEIDLVYVAVPPKWHAAIALDVIAAGKHILCEKPLAHTREQAREMRDRAQAAGIVHAMNFPTYYKNVFTELQRRIADGSLGELRRIEVVTNFHQWPRPWQQVPWLAQREQGGFVREVVPHYLHLIRTLFGRIESVDSEVSYPAGDDLACENGIVAKMALEDGTPVVLTGLGNIAEQEHISFKMYGTQGTLALVNWSVLMEGGVGEPLREVELIERDRLVGLVDEVVKATRGEAADLIGFEIGYDVQVVLDALLDDAGAGRVLLGERYL